ncbi:MAG: Obg family GTPase CgtA [Spirochaetia bacterium]
MNYFLDETKIEVHSGNGGNGAIAFHREKYVERGGPDGGDGGRGGHIIFSVRRNLKTFTHLQSKRKFYAPNGISGSGRKRAGAAGENLRILVPPGTRILEPETRKVIIDLGTQETDYLFLIGGQGGRGNWHFRTSKRQAPEYAEKGKPGSGMQIILELSLIADVGLVGLPNAGKSTLVNALTNANSKVGDYPFTTKTPHLGLIRRGDEEIILADIPGIIKGASEGIGLGLQFLKHIRRTRGLAFLIDLHDENYEQTLSILLHELALYEPTLLQKKRVIVATKSDLCDDVKQRLDMLKKQYPEDEVIEISTHQYHNLDVLVKKMWYFKYTDQIEVEYGD